MFVNFMCVHNYGYCYGNEVEGDEDDDGNYYSCITIQLQFLWREHSITSVSWILRPKALFAADFAPYRSTVQYIRIYTFKAYFVCMSVKSSKKHAPFDINFHVLCVAVFHDNAMESALAVLIQKNNNNNKEPRA